MRHTIDTFIERQEKSIDSVLLGLRALIDASPGGTLRDLMQSFYGLFESALTKKEERLRRVELDRDILSKELHESQTETECFCLARNEIEEALNIRYMCPAAYDIADPRERSAARHKAVMRAIRDLQREPSKPSPDPTIYSGTAGYDDGGEVPTSPA